MVNNYKTSLQFVIDETGTKKEFAKFAKNFAKQGIAINVQLDKDSLLKASKEIMKLEQQMASLSFGSQSLSVEYDSSFSEMYTADFEHFSGLLVSIKNHMKDLKGISLNSNMEMLDKLNDLSGLKNLQSGFKTLPAQAQKATSGVKNFANQAMSSLASMRVNVQPIAFENNEWSLNGVSRSSIAADKAKSQNDLRAYNSNRHILNNNPNNAQAQQRQSQIIASATANNSSFGAYLEGLNGAPASMEAYVRSLISATVKTVGLTIASAALNTAISMGVSLAIQGIIFLFTEFAQAIDKINNPLKYALEDLNNIQGKISDLKSEIDSLNNTITDLEKIKNPTFLEERELEKARELNKELETELKFREILERFATKDVREKAKQDFEKDFIQEDYSKSNIRKHKRVFENYKSELANSMYTPEVVSTGSAESGYGLGVASESNVYTTVAEANEALSSAMTKHSSLKLESPIASLIAEKEYYNEILAEALQKNDSKGVKAAETELERLTENLLDFAMSLNKTRSILADDPESTEEINSIDEGLNAIKGSILAPDNKLESFVSQLNGLQRSNLIELYKADKLNDRTLENQFPELDKSMGDNGITIDALRLNLDKLIESYGRIPLPPSMSDTIGELHNMEDAISNASSAYEDFKKNGKITNFDTISNLSKDFDGVEGFDSYVNTLNDPSSSAEDAQEALKNLITEYVTFSTVLKEVDENQANLIVSRLEEMGIQNAQALVNEGLASSLTIEALAKEYLIQTDSDLADASFSTMNQFLNEAIMSEEAKIAFAQLALGKDELNGKAIVTTGDIQSLIDLATQAHATKASIDRLRGIQQVEANIKKGNFPSFPELLQYGKDRFDLATGKTGLEYETKKTVEFDVPPPPPPPLRPNRSSSNNNKPKEFSNNIDWAKQSVENLESSISRLESALDNTNLSFGDQNNLLNESISKQQELANAYQHSANVYEAEWNRLKSEIPEEYAIKIQSGETFSIEQFTNEETYKKIQAATTGSKQFLTAQQNVTKETQKLHKLEKEVYELRQKNLDSQLNTLDRSKQNITNTLDELSEIDQSGTEKQYQTLIENSKLKENIYLQKLQEALARNATLTPDSEEYGNSLEEIQKCRDALSECKQEQLGWTKNMMELPINQLEKANQKLQRQLEILNKQQTEYDNVISGVIAGIDEEIKSINILKTEKEEELKLFQKTNEERERQLALEQAQYNFERAKNQKSVKILKNGEFVYEADQDALKGAKDELDKLEYDSQVQSMQDAVDLLDEEISKLDEIKTAWSDIADSVERLKNISLATSLLGAGWKEKVLSGEEKSFNYVTMLYGSNASNRESLESQIEINDELIMQINDYVSAWQDGEISIWAALEGISESVKDTEGEIAATDQRIQSVIAYSNIWQGASNQIQTALANMNATQTNTALEEKATLDQRIVNMTDFSVQFAVICQILEATALAMTGQLNNSVQAAANAVNTLNRLAQEAESARERIGGNSRSMGRSSLGIPPYYHTGIEKGLISKNGGQYNGDDRENMLRFLSTQKLKSDEIPIIAKIGEAVFNEDQQNTLLSNMSSLITPTTDYLIKSPTLSMLHHSRKPSEIQFQFSIGDINLDNVQDPNGLANALYTQFQPCLQQKMADIFNR